MNAARPFDAMYFDSNVLLANHWPDPLPDLRNILELAQWGLISSCFPAAVLEEVECHWYRELQDSLAAAQGSRSKLLKAARPLELAVAEVSIDLEDVRTKYRTRVRDAIKHFDIQVVDFTHRSVEEVFGHAMRYKRPFAAKGEGKGFQDAVILLSVLDHLETQPEWSAVLLTKDGDLTNVDYKLFAPKFEEKRLRVIDPKAAFDALFHPYFDETRVKPYEKLLAEANEMVRADVKKLQDFVASRITPDILQTELGDRILQVISLATMEILSVQVPFPKDGPVSNVDISIKVMGTCYVRVVTDLAALRGLFGRITTSTDPVMKEQDKKIAWFGLIEATGSVVNGTLHEITPQLLAGDKP